MTTQWTGMPDGGPAYKASTRELARALAAALGTADAEAAAVLRDAYTAYVATFPVSVAGAPPLTKALFDAIDLGTL